MTKDIDQIASLSKLLYCLWKKIPLRRKIQLAILLVIMVITSFAEVMSIGAALPFLGALTAPERLFQSEVMQPFVQYFRLTNPEQIIFLLTIFFGLAALAAGVLRLFMLWVSTRLSFAIGAELSSEMYKRTLYQPYQVHCARNSSEVINGITTKANAVIYSMLLPSLIIINSGIMLIAIMAALFYVQPLVALSAFFGFSFIYLGVILVTRKKLIIDSEIIAQESSAVVKSLQEGLGGIRDVLIDGAQATYCNLFRSADLSLRQSQGNNLFIAQSPRYVVESLGMVLIAFLAYSLSQSKGGITSAIPVLGAFALGAQRLLPVLQQSYSSWINISGAQASLKDVIKFLDQPLPEYHSPDSVQKISFKSKISLVDLNFRYSPESAWVLKDLNLTIEKGSRVGFIGSTGSGKSTLLDVVMTLLWPTRGVVAIDGVILTPQNQRAWQAQIAHVPQSIFLSDGTVEENIAFGIPKNEIHLERVREAAKQAQIADVIESFPDKYETLVGERGIRLSGGQRQRIGIARALYKNANVIVFDEATSALDGETENAVMEAIESLSKDLTILIIAHRLSTLRGCTQVVKLEMGSVRHISSDSQIVSLPNLNRN